LDLGPRHALSRRPDEVHLRTVARNELARAKTNRGATAAYYLLPLSAGNAACFF